MISEEKYSSLLKKINYLTWFMHQNVSKAEHERWLTGVFYNLNGYYPNFRNPKSFNEKMCWLRLNYTSKELKIATDKASFKSYIRDQIGEGFTAVQYGIYDDPLDIEFGLLPEKFVLKSTFSSASNNVKFVHCKSDLVEDEVRYEVLEWLQPWQSSAKSFSNWYRGVVPRILAEELLEDPDGDLKDYKFMCCNGEPRFLLVVSDRFGGKYFNFYDLEWGLLPFEGKFRNAPYVLEPPNQLDRMIGLSKTLAKSFPFVRVDFYEVGDRLLVGELTFSPGGGLEPFSSIEWDYKLGDLLKLPDCN